METLVNMKCLVYQYRFPIFLGIKRTQLKGIVEVEVGIEKRDGKRIFELIGIAECPFCKEEIEGQLWYYGLKYPGRVKVQRCSGCGRKFLNVIKVKVEPFLKMGMVLAGIKGNQLVWKY